MTTQPPTPTTPQSPPRGIPAMPDPNRARPEPAEGEERHWPDLPINEVPDDEREALLNQAGPVGEQARLAWNSYLEEHPQEEDPASIARERTRLVETGQTPPEDREALEAQKPQGPEVETPTTEAAEASTEGLPKGQAGAVAAGTQEGGPGGDRAEAERKAEERGLEIRDYGTSGEWRVYDPETGRMVARSVLDEPVK